MKTGEVIGYKNPDPHTHIYYIRDENGDHATTRSTPIWDVGDEVKLVEVGVNLDGGIIRKWRLHKKSSITSEKEGET